MQATRIKMCGITRPEDARFAVESGADAIGLVFYPKSKRYVSPAQAQALLRDIPPFVASVGLFVDAEAKEVEATLAQVPLSLLQFHGDETAEYCESFRRPYIKAVRFRVDADENVSLQTNQALLKDVMQEHINAQGFLIDSYHPQHAGGSGESFAWSQIPDQLERPIILAGGLSASNVGDAISQVQPYAVDVSSGIESQPGEKSVELMSAFVAAVRP